MEDYLTAHLSESKPHVMFSPVILQKKKQYGKKRNPITTRGKEKLLRTRTQLIQYIIEKTIKQYFLAACFLISCFSTYSANRYWIGGRIIWMDANMPGNCTGSSTEENLPVNAFSVYPNPTSGVFMLEAGQQTTGAKQITIYNVYGEKVYETNDDTRLPDGQGQQTDNTQTSVISHPSSVIIDLSSQPSGIYFLSIGSESKSVNQKLIIQK